MDTARPLRCSTPRARRPRTVLAAACCFAAAVSSGRAHGAPWTSNGPTGGIVNAVAADPATPTTVYAATNGGGFFKSLDAGDTWTAASAGIPDVASTILTGLAVDPVTPDRVYGTARLGASGGVLRSTDGGASWSFTATGVLNAIAVHPATPSTLYAVGDGIRKSSDAGTSWAQVQTGSFFCVGFAPSSPGTVYAGGMGGLLRSTDGGVTWTPLFGSGSEPVRAVAVHPTMPAVAYVGVEDAGVWKTVDGGITWTPLGPDVGGHPLTVFTLVIDPAAPDTVYAGGAHVAGGFSVYETVDGGATWSSTPLRALTSALAIVPGTPARILAGTQGGGIRRSTDGASTWTAANTGFVNTAVRALAVDATPGTVYAATNLDGVVRSTDGGTTWTPTAFIGASDPLTALAADPSASGTVYVGTTLHGVFKTTDGGDGWAPLPGGDEPVLVTSLLVDPSSPSRVYAGGFGGVFVSTTGGGTWTNASTGLFPLVSSMAIDPTTPHTLYAGTVLGGSAGIFKTTDAAGSWAPINTGLPAHAGAAVTALAVDPAAPATVYAAIEDAGVFKTTNAGASWAAAGVGLTSVRVTALTFDPVLPDTVYAGTRDQGVFASADGGASWTPLDDGLVNRSVAALAADAARIYAGSGGNGTFVRPAGSIVTTTSTTTSTSSTTSTTLQQAVLGRTFEVRNPNAADPSRRKLVVTAKEAASDDTLDAAALAANGATLTIVTAGGTPSSQTFAMPPPWTLLGTTGARYVDAPGTHGPVKRAQVSKTATGTFELAVEILGRLGPGEQPHVVIVPPDPGIGASAVLRVNRGAAYCVAFGGAAGGRIADKAGRAFKVTKPTVQTCAP